MYFAFDIKCIQNFNTQIPVTIYRIDVQTICATSSVLTELLYSFYIKSAISRLNSSFIYPNQ